MAILRVLVVVEQRLARRASGWSRVEWGTGHTTARRRREQVRLAAGLTGLDRKETR